jgi:hypothetical protein
VNKVVHVNREYFDIYMGREFAGYKESPYANPFRIIKGIRGSAIERFAAYWYAPEQKWLREKALSEIPSYAILGCWCAPKFCHCDIVAGYLEYKRRK